MAKDSLAAQPTDNAPEIEGPPLEASRLWQPGASGREQKEVSRNEDQSKKQWFNEKMAQGQFPELTLDGVTNGGIGEARTEATSDHKRIHAAAERVSEVQQSTDFYSLKPEQQMQIAKTIELQDYLRQFAQNPKFIPKEKERALFLSRFELEVAVTLEGTEEDTLKFDRLPEFGPATKAAYTKPQDVP